MKRAFSRASLLALALALFLAPPVSAQKAGQKIDEEYTRLIKQHLQDPRITTEPICPRPVRFPHR